MSNDQDKQSTPDALPEWLAAWIAPTEAAPIPDDFVQGLREAAPHVRNAIITYPPMAGARCRCCGEVGVLMRAIWIGQGEGRHLALVMASAPEQIEDPESCHVSSAILYDVIGYHLGITPELLTSLAATVGDA